MAVRDRLKHAYNAFLNRDPVESVSSFNGYRSTELGSGYASSPFRSRFGFAGERTVLASIYLRLAMDAASVDIRHVKRDEQDRYVDDVKSGMHNCLNVEANIDQSGRAFLQDLYLSLFEGGHIAILPIDMSTAPMNGGLFDIQSWRVGTVVQWFPRYVTVEAYNDRTGRREQVTVEKRHVALIENPLFPVMNEPNSTLQRLIRKLSLLDSVDEQVASGKLDMFIQLPYPIRNEGRRADAAQRRQDIEFQMKDSQYGIAYIDATEKVTQLNRPAENNLLKQVEYLLDLLYTQLGLTPAVMNGTAAEPEMINYFNRTIEPVIDSVAAELRRKFLTKTARTQGHDLMYFRDPFKLVPMSQLAELADKFTRNEIVSSNEFRGFIGLRPAKDPKADMLINSNLTVPQTQLPGGIDVNGNPVPASGPDPEVADPATDADLTAQEDMFASVNKTLDEVFAQIGVAG
jgi:hypothetical protein